MGRIFQWPLDAFYWIRTAFVWLIAYVSLRFYGVEVHAKDVWDGTYRGRTHANRELGKSTDLSAVLSAAKDCHKTAQERRSTITDKCKTLLTVSSLLLGLTGLLLPKPFIFDATWTRVVFFVAVAGLLNTVTLLLLFFDVGTETEISLDQQDVDLGADDLKKNLINLYLNCQNEIENRTDYLVDLYRAARFFFLLSLTLVVFLFTASFFTHAPGDEVRATIERLRGEPRLIELLRGPKGEEGVRGSKGEQGEQGIRGQQGDRGDDATVNEDELLNRLLADPRMLKLIDDSVQKRAVPPPTPKQPQ